MNKPDVYIVTPTHSGDVCAPYALALLETIALLGANGLATQPSFIMNNADVELARALGIKRFMDSGADHLLFVDSDLYWDAKGALALVQSPYDFSAGVYPAKTPDWVKVFQTRNITGCDDQTYLETDGVPGGFMCLTRKAIEKMIAAYPELTLKYKMGKESGTRMEIPLLFAKMTDDGSVMGEDYSFCKRWCDLGEKIYIYPDIEFAHYGRGEWRGNMITDDPRLNIIP